MIKATTLAIIAATAAISIATPALAQTPRYGDPLPGEKGFHSFALVPGEPHSYSVNPEANGGGSAGYNTLILQY
ncbi:MAG TPA: hypothetical protein VMF12_09605 [Xanthobacteraceae bacterium]|nr:hypothetical protein [Xanthobacteraceae bacterium]